MYFEPCNAIHTVGMRYPIDVAFLDRSGVVLRVVEALRPMRMTMCWRAKAAVELAAGECRRAGLRPMQHLSMACRDAS